jgi:uncharacterized Zn finger protein
MGAGLNQAAPAATPLRGCLERMLETVKLAQRGFKRQPALLFFEIPNAQLTA